jgi:hypothetical protein
MSEYRVTMHYNDGTTEELEEVFSSMADAEEYGDYMVSCCHEGAEILHMSNPGDYPDDNAGDVYYEIEED